MERAQREITVPIVETVSNVLELPIEELPPLSEAINVDAVDALVPSTGNRSSPDVTVTFTYAGVHVIVCSGNTVYAQPIREQQETPPGSAPINE